MAKKKTFETLKPQDLSGGINASSFYARISGGATVDKAVQGYTPTQMRIKRIETSTMNSDEQCRHWTLQYYKAISPRKWKMKTHLAVIWPWRKKRRWREEFIEFCQGNNLVITNIICRLLKHSDGQHRNH